MNWIKRLLGSARVPMAMIVALTVCGAGCQSDDKDDPTARAGEEFLRDDETSAVSRIAERQMAAGAAAEATLRPYHFDHARLNSLGREKLDLMLAAGADEAATEGDELVVYVDVADDGAHAKHADARRASVSAYLTSHAGLAEGEFRVESGPNPYNTMSAATAAPNDDADAGAEGETAAGADASGYGEVSGMAPAK